MADDHMSSSVINKILKMTELKNENSKKLVKRGKIPLFSKNLNIININFAYL